MNIDGIQIAEGAFRGLLERFSVKELALFGSRARGDSHAGSDVDLLVDFLPNSKIDLFDFVELKLLLEDMLGVGVDLVERDAVKPRMQKRVYAEARPIYAIQ